jgi:hypothetical protein
MIIPCDSPDDLPIIYLTDISLINLKQSTDIIKQLRVITQQYILCVFSAL